MVFGLVSAVAGFVKVRLLADKEVIDNAVFRCHYRVTSAIMFVFSILCTANSLLGPPIECLYDDKKNEHVINTFCWIKSTFTVPEFNDPSFVPGKHVAYAGVGNVPSDAEDSKRYHSYYQWVPFVLFLQGLMFYAPHYVWKNWEEGKVRMISDGIRGTMTKTREERKTQQARLVRYIVESMSLHGFYATGYFFCEMLNFVNVLVNIFMTDKFLGGHFLTYGLDATMYSGDDHNSTMSKVFPRVTKCTFHKYGPGGSPQVQDSLCVLALNIINEKIYIFLWFWFIIMAIISGLALFYSAAIILFPGVRKVILERRFKFRVPQGLAMLVAKTQVGDFLLLHLLGQNINTTVFGDILNDLSQELDSQPSGGYGGVPTTPSTAMEMAPMYPTKEFLAQ